MKKFLILQLRPEDVAADNELEAFLMFGKIGRDEYERVRMERDGIPDVALDDYAAVIVGGGPSNVSDANEEKSDAQKHFEHQLRPLLDVIIARDMPFLGACYGIGALGAHLGARVSKERYGEPVGATHLTLTEEGKNDPLLRGLPEAFDAFCGHKEACQEVPENATLLVTSAACPVQMIRYGEHVYATQFHPELDTRGIITRINVYKHAGYFPPEDAETLIAQVQNKQVEVPQLILERFVARYRQ